MDLCRTMLAGRGDGVPFMALTPEAVLSAIGETGAPDLAALLHERHTAFTPVHRLIDGGEPFTEDCAR
ncbi:hypothetical protein [Xanthobacter sediminis]